MEQILEILSKMVESAEQGIAPTTEVLYNINQLAEELKKAKAQIEDSAFDEFYRYQEGNEATIEGYHVTHRNGGYTWDFKSVDEWVLVDSKKKALEKKYKGIFEHSKCTDLDTGEVLDIKRKPRKDSLIIKKI